MPKQFTQSGQTAQQAAYQCTTCFNNVLDVNRESEASSYVYVCMSSVRVEALCDRGCFVAS